MNYNTTVEEFLKQARQVTSNYLQAGGEWPESEQWQKINEEEDEFRNAPDRANQLEEFWDCFFAKLTLLHILGYDDSYIIESANSTLKKITDRSNKVLQTVEASG